MADEKRDAPRPFDVRTVEYLIKLMADHDLSEVDLREGELRIRLRKGAAIPAGFMPPPAMFAHAAPPHPSSTAASAASAAPPAAAAKKYIEIKSEYPGTFYTRPSPDKPEYVKVGAKVTPDTTVCLVIAMKVENPVKAGVSGTIAEIVA